MEKLNFKKLLIVDITRKCNRNCIHCMNGEPEDQSISNKTIDALLDQTQYIRKLYISGGEPLIELERIRYLLDSLKKRNIVVEKVRVITNGTIQSEEFCDLFREFTEFTTKKKSKIVISYDPFHNQVKSSLTADFYIAKGFTVDLERNNYVVCIGNAVEHWEEIKKIAKNPRYNLVTLYRNPIAYRVPYYRNNINCNITITDIGNIYCLDAFTYKEDDTNTYRIGNVKDNILESIKVWNKSDQVIQLTRLRDIYNKITNQILTWEKNIFARLLPWNVRKYVYDLYWNMLEAEKILKESEPFLNDDNRKFFEGIYKLLENRATIEEGYFEFFDENGKPHS